MDAQKYHHLTLHLGWRLSKNSLEGRRRNYEQDYDDFAEFVIRELRHSAAVGARRTYSVGSSMREVRFSASASLTIEEWSQAINAAVKACFVMTDQSMWSFA
jgi:hypothetical protein